MTLKSRLSKLSDELLDIAAETDNEEAKALLRKAGYIADDVRLMNIETVKAVGEVVTVAFHQAGGIGDAEPIVLRERAA